MINGIRSIRPSRARPVDVRRGPPPSRELLNAVSALAHALEAKDAYTRGHSARVSVYGQAIARRLRLDQAGLTAVVLGGELHDIGKIGVPGRLLRKTGPLSPEEHRRVMEHTVIGERILLPLLSDRRDLLGVVRWHHERVDGSGLPDGLRGAEIPLPARIVAVADAYDAMTSARPYRKPLGVEQAFLELRRGAGTQFDEICVAAFLTEFGDRVVPPVANRESVRIQPFVPSVPVRTWNRRRPRLRMPSFPAPAAPLDSRFARWL